MARPKKLTRDPDKRPRSYAEIQQIHGMAERLYLMTGGASLDLQIEAMDTTQRCYTRQVAAAEAGQPYSAGLGPDVTTYEARMSASTASRLHKQREQKMQQCLLLAEEGAENEAEAAAVGAGLAPPANQPAAAGDASVAPTGAQRDVQAAAEDGDSPQKRGQSPLFPGSLRASVADMMASIERGRGTGRVRAGDNREQ